MEKATRYAILFNIVFVIGLSVWIFGHDPLPEQLVARKADPDRTISTERRGKGDAENIVAKARNAPLTVEPAGADPVGLKVPGSEETGDDDPDTLVLTGTSIRMRAGPTSSSSHVGTYRGGDKFKQIGKKGRWIQVRHLDDGTEGWIYGKYLKPQG